MINNPGDTDLFVIDFYFKTCMWCQKFEATWKQLVDYFVDDYGTKIVFLKINTRIVPELSKRYNVRSCPTIVSQDPNFSDSYTFKDKRNFENLQQWIMTKYDNAN